MSNILKKDNVKIEIVNINAGLAEKMLAANKNNRPLSEDRVNDYKREMIGGTWKFTHQGIAIDEDGNLLDGQHRLIAIMKANVAINVLVVTGLPRGIFAYIDRGKNRTARDLFSIEGYEYADHVAASVRMAMLLSKDKLFSNNFKTRNQDGLESMLAYVKENKDFYDDVVYSLKFNTLKRYIGKGLLGGMYYICKQKDPALADEMFGLLNSGAIGDPNSVLLACRNKLIMEKEDSKNRYINQAYLGVLMVNTWNHLRRGERDARLQVDLTKPIDSLI